MEEEMKEYKFTTQRGNLSIENKEIINKMPLLVDVGIRIAKDGRIWLCVDGQAFIRFKPIDKKIEELL